MSPGLKIPGDPESILEPDERAVVEREEILGELSEAALPEVAGESVRQPEIALVPAQRSRRRQVREVELDFRLGDWRRRRVADPVVAAARCTAGWRSPKGGPSCTAHVEVVGSFVLAWLASRVPCRSRPLPVGLALKVNRFYHLATFYPFRLSKGLREA